MLSELQDYNWEDGFGDLNKMESENIYIFYFGLQEYNEIKELELENYNEDAMSNNDINLIQH